MRRSQRIWRRHCQAHQLSNIVNFTPYTSYIPYVVSTTTGRQRRTIRRLRRQSQRAAVMALHRNRMPPDVIANIRSFLEPADLS